MENSPLEYPYIAVISCIFLIAWSIQIYYLLFRFLKSTSPSTPLSKDKPGVSVIICARNEERNLMEHVPEIMEQDYPHFELIIVNDNSWDDTGDILKAMQVSHPNIRVVSLDEEKQNMQGKKFALTLGIKAAQHDIILLTDADCKPLSNQWISGMVSHFSNEKEVVLGVSLFHRYKGWLNKIIRFDALMTAAHYIGFARVGKPYMGVGRNLAYHKELFFSVGGFKNHYHILSGDDDLFINQVANKKNTAVSIESSEQTISEPKTSWNEWFIQKRRHFSTAPFYKANHKRVLFAWPLSFLLMWVAFGFSVVFHKLLLILGAMLLLRYITQLTILHKISGKMAQSKDIVWFAPFLEIQLHLMNAGLYFSNLFRKPGKWKK